MPVKLFFDIFRGIFCIGVYPVGWFTTARRWMENVSVLGVHGVARG
jgi:hypothetical protein